MKPMGNGPRRHPSLSELKLPALGSGPRWHVLLTKSLLFAVQTSREQVIIWALDKTDGEKVWEMQIPIRTGDPTGSPMTYMHEGKQYIVFAAGGGSADPSELIALGLP